VNKHLIEVRYIPASARKPARISLTSHETGERVILKTEFQSIAAVPESIKYLDGKQFTVATWGKMKKGRFIIVNEFKSLKGAA
jgi:hypothetical protein